MGRIEHIADGVTLYLGDCREGRHDLADVQRRKPWGKTPIKAVVSCKQCDWTWKPSTGFGIERCPQCGKIRSVREQKFKPNLPAIKKNVKRKKSSSEWERTYRRRAKLLVGRGALICVRCGCDRPDLLEINHKNGGGGKEFKALGNKFYRTIAKMQRSVDDLELLCKPCNAVHALELKYGPLPFKIVWG